MALSDNLISYYSLAEASGNATDAHSTNHLTDTNTVASAAGIVGNARDFETANSEYFTIADASFTGFPSSAATWAFWMNLESISADKAFLSKWANPASNTFLFEVDSVGQNGQLFIASTTADTGSNRAQIPLATFTTATWYFCVVVFNGAGANNAARLRFFVNDVEITLTYTGTIPATLADGTAPFQLGGCSALTRFHDGLIDEFGFWGRALTSAERTELYNAGAGRDYAYISGGGGGGIARNIFGRNMTGGMKVMNGGIA